MNQQILVQLTLIAVLSIGVSTITTSCVSCTPQEEIRKQQLAQPKTEIEKKVKEVGEAKLTPGEKAKLREHREADKYLYGKHVKDPEQFYFPEVEKGKPKVINAKKAEEHFKAFRDGLQYKDLSEGFGIIPEPGGRCLIHYTGWLSDGSKFDTSMKKLPLKFKYGKGEIIRGLDEGVTGMKVGGVRKLVVPAPLAYGSKGNSELGVPPNETLTYVVKLLSAGK